MPKRKKAYEVIVTRPATEFTLIRVKAASLEEANDEALEQARIKGDALKWEVNEDNYNDPDEFYIGDEGWVEKVD
jgi:sarcosine oxidase gamma subunit